MTSDERLQTILRELPVPEPSPDFFDRLEASLHEEARKPAVIDLRDTKRRWWKAPNLRRFPAWVAAAAAIALLAAAIGIAITLVNDDGRVPEVVETPTGTETEGATGTLDFSAIAGTWRGDLYSTIGELPAWVEVTIEPSAGELSQVGIARYGDEPDGDVACMSRWLASRADAPEYEVIEDGVGATPCPSEDLRPAARRQPIHERVRLTHDADTDTLTFEFVDSDLPPKPLTRAPDSASGPDLLGSSRFAVPFVIDAEVTGMIRCQCAVEEQEVGFRTSTGQLVFTVAGPKSIEAWQRKFAEAEGTSTTEPFLAEVGGTTGSAIDATMGEEPLLLYTIAPQPGQVSQYGAEAGDRLRVISLQIVTDDPPSPNEDWIVSVIISAQAEDFDEWLAFVEPLLESIRWEVTPEEFAGAGADDGETDELSSGDFSVPFTMPRDELGRVSASSNNQAEEAWFGAGRIRAEITWPRPTDLLVFKTEGPDTVEGWIEQMRSSEKADFSLSEPFPTAIGGVEGMAVDATVQQGEYMLYSISFGNTPPLAVAGDVIQIHVVQVDGEPVSVIMIAAEDDFGSWAQTVGPMLEQLEWGNAG